MRRTESYIERISLHRPIKEVAGPKLQPCDGLAASQVGKQWKLAFDRPSFRPPRPTTRFPLSLSPSVHLLISLARNGGTEGRRESGPESFTNRSGKMSEGPADLPTNRPLVYSINQPYPVKVHPSFHGSDHSTNYNSFSTLHLLQQLIRMALSSLLPKSSILWMALPFSVSVLWVKKLVRHNRTQLTMYDLQART